MSGITLATDDRVLVDFRTADDAGVYRLDENTALVQTVDFFTPIVDDPADFGSIAAANALSDVYAMGGVPLTALAIAALPRHGFPTEDIRAIFAGGHLTLAEAGVALLGGHTVQDTEVKFGYAVTGVVRPGAQWTNAGARPGDGVLLTKQLGTGIVSTAIKHDKAPAEVVSAAVTSMKTLNRRAADIFRAAPAGAVHGCTDVTGFSLLGHACEMALASRVRLHIRLDAVPVLPGARELAATFRPGGTANNEAHFGEHVRLPAAIDGVTKAILFDPQTSGGLLVCVDAKEASRLHAELVAAGVPVAFVGHVESLGAADSPGVTVT